MLERPNARTMKRFRDTLGKYEGKAEKPLPYEAVYETYKRTDGNISRAALEHDLPRKIVRWMLVRISGGILPPQWKVPAGAMHIGHLGWYVMHLEGRLALYRDNDNDQRWINKTPRIVTYDIRDALRIVAAEGDGCEVYEDDVREFIDLCDRRIARKYPKRMAREDNKG